MRILIDECLYWRLSRALSDHYIAPCDSEGYSIKVVNAVGDTIAVSAVPATDLEPLREDEFHGAPSTSG